MRDYERIKVERDGPVERVTLSYPERRNAIGPLMTSELLYALEDARGDAEVRVIVITGEGKSFCAGGDFAQMTGEDASAVSPEGGSREEAGPPKLAARGDYAGLLLALAKSSKPIIARVNGAAMGGGLGIVAASTFAIASSDATLGTPEIQVGLFPMMIMAVLARLVPRRRLLEMMLLGEKMDAAEAARIGLVGQVVAPEELDDAVKALAARLSASSPRTMALGLRAFAAQEDRELEEALPMLRDRLAECLGTDDAREGLTAFLEKRKPIWTGR